MEVKRVRITNRKQFEHLVHWMEENPKVAKGQKYCEATGINIISYEEKWSNLAVALNSRGPPTRSVKDWQRLAAMEKIGAESTLVGQGPKAESTRVKLAVTQMYREKKKCST
ncbi:uncharacterized protein LOC134216254 [Armigeres subalbatus]|uniref:uncharacterized protein LOC134216254 n=1 Tax=Armigeres subalbatus TaxID=124917 RepID=UPI002ED41109